MPGTDRHTPGANVGPTGRETPEMHPPVENPDVHHEYSDVNVRAIFYFLLGLVIVAVVVHGAMWLMFRFFNEREARAEPPRAPLAMPGGRQPPEPRLQTTPRLDWRLYRQSEDQMLATYEWVDEKGGVVRIPIDRAMQLVVERGFPVAPQRVAERLAPTSLGPSSGRPGTSARGGKALPAPAARPETATKPAAPHSKH